MSVHVIEWSDQRKRCMQMHTTAVHKFFTGKVQNEEMLGEAKFKVL